MTITDLTPALLRRAAHMQERIASLQQELASLLGSDASAGTPRKTRGMSAAGRARIAAAQRARWAKQKSPAKPRRKMSAAGRKRMAQAAKARWAKAKAAGRNRL